jgi:hypothetical protein
MTTGRINQVAFTYTHGYLAILGKFNQLSGRLKPSVPLPNVAVKSSASNKVIHRKSGIYTRNGFAIAKTINVC